MRRDRFSVLVAASAFTLLSACAHKTSATLTPQSIGRDSLVGIVAVTGTSFQERIELRSANRSTPLNASPIDARALKRLSGVEIVARGAAGASGFDVTSFTALRADGQPVLDGFLRSESGRYFLESSDGARHSIASPPPAFGSLAGARIWIGGSLATGPNVYGVIIPPP